ncbi:hypothetical protein M3649_03850 [Ureibacillus chungkukjangi]|uniref:hypothetical protein n=1 Tax=Ureibacillus chungkukjangi TaxID=1202712 RepID=UPI00203F59B4|nr:hypothetical protein [Ureibacillus chungkukjangi]MCM3387265.1 hypothetical protein [Ureibacillus chungkukjangi]
MDYKEYAKEISDLNTNIITVLDKNYRITSIYRRYSNPHFEKWAWETFLWCNGEIVEKYRVLDFADDVVSLHTEIIDKFYNEI